MISRPSNDIMTERQTDKQTNQPSNRPTDADRTGRTELTLPIKKEKKMHTLTMLKPFLNIYF